VLARHDIAPDFILPTPAGIATRFYGLAGGCTTLLAFLPGGDTAVPMMELASLAAELEAPLFVVSRDAPASTPADGLVFVDADGAVGKRYGVGSDACLFVLSQNLRVIEAAGGSLASAGRAAISGLRPSNEPGHAPVLLIPNALDDDYCDRLIQIAEAGDSEATGVEVSRDGQRTNALDASVKRRRDHIVMDAELMAEITTRVGRRVIPEVWKAFSFRATRFEGFKICCYEGDDGGFFAPHRDNLSPGTSHRRFALTLNLNDDYDGGHLQFPEYGGARYRPGKGGAVVFSGSLLHEALTVTRGRRYVLLSFLYREQDGRRARPAPV
jgi:predicted 2-oxoglutarate/Fe(II)-dependent dioxygenase YbiX